MSTEGGKVSEEGEYLLVQQKIAEKVDEFPRPTVGTLHIILVDVRGFGGVGSLDEWDFRHIAYGASGLQDVYVRFWQGKPIVGLFEENNPTKKAKLLRERIHFIGLTNETTYKAGELRDPRAVLYLANPVLVPKDKSQAIWGSIPFRPMLEPPDTTASS